MYKIDKITNSLEKLEKKQFKELKFKERDHLQEWIAKNPEILGEELLIIQKEFDGFNDTNERLDLLALDKDGGLVIIENKLDDSGRDVVWQAVKYTSYCSTLTTSQITKLYQSYLDLKNVGEDATQNIIEFLEKREEELILNRNDQRIILVANNFRKEVTSAVLWLSKHNIQIQCFKAIPYSMGNETFLQVEQIIPLPETKEFMIDAQEKEREENTKSITVKDSEERLIKFWTLLKEKLRETNFTFLNKTSAKPYYNLGFHRGPGLYSFCIGKQTFRVELYFTNDTEKEYFDAMAKYKEQISKAFNGGLSWERLDDKKASRIKFEMTLDQANSLPGRFADELYWDELISWYADAMLKFYNAFNPYLEKVLKKELS